MFFFLFILIEWLWKNVLLRKTWPSKDKSTLKCILAFKRNPEFCIELSKSLVWRIS